MTGQRAKLELLQDNSSNQIITITDGGSHHINDVGSITILTNPGGINLSRVLYVPTLKNNLMSVGSIANDDYKLVFIKMHYLIMDNDVLYQPIAIGHRDSKTDSIDVSMNHW